MHNASQREGVGWSKPQWGLGTVQGVEVLGGAITGVLSEAAVSLSVFSHYPQGLLARVSPKVT